MLYVLGSFMGAVPAEGLYMKRECHACRGLVYSGGLVCRRSMHEGSPAHRGLHMQGMCAYKVVVNVWRGCVCSGDL